MAGSSTRGENKAPDNQLSFYDDLNTALEAHGSNVPSLRSVVQWMAADFEPTTQVVGYPKPSVEHTTVFPHAADACSMFVVLNGDVVKLEKSLKRQKQQGHQGDKRLQTAIIELKRALEDTNAEVTRHSAEADAAIVAYKVWVTPAPAIYERLSEQFDAFLKLGSNARAKDVDGMATAASSFRFDINSDFQQDKHIPTWNAS